MRLKPGKITVSILISVFILLLAVFFAISPVAKYVIEKNSVEWTGRKITMEHLFINLWEMNVTVKDLKVYENKSDAVFFSAGKIFTDISVLTMFKGEYSINTVQIESPKVVVTQTGDHFNFDDLVTRFTAVDTTKKEPEKPSEPTKYRVERMEITGGTIMYRDKVMNNEIVLQQFKLGCPLLVWNSQMLNASTEFTFKSGGKADLRLSLNLDSLAYQLTANIQKLDLQLIKPYLKDYVKTSYLGGFVSSKLFIKGDFDVPEAVAIKGNISLADFRIDDEAKVTVASWKDFAIAIDSLDVAGNIYNFGEISLENPYVLFEYYATSDNFTNMMVPSETVSTDTAVAVDMVDYSNPFTIMADYVKQISKDYIISNYTAKDVLMHKGHIVYKDYTLEDKFVYDLENLEMSSGRIDSKSDSITFGMSCLANRSGKLKAHLAFDPRDYMNMSINYNIEKMRISDFNPYSKFYVAHAFVEGMLFYNSTNTIRNGKLKSTNVMSIKKIEVSKKMKGMGLYEMPLRLAITILTDRKGNIDLDIPVEGDLKDPTYKFGKVIWQIVKNLVVKAATAPFDLLAKAFGGNEEDIKYVRFDYLQNQFEARQMKSLDMISKALADKPELKIAMVQVASHQSEKELLGLSLAKGIYYKKNILQTPKDSLDAMDYKAIEAISNLDSLFNIWLNQQLLPEDVSGMPSQIKCLKLIGDQALGQEVDKLFAIRNKMVLDYFVKEKQIDSTRIKITNTLDEKSAEFESTPRYAVEFVVDE
ncbi:MAG: DUF748 domain-containing protein [Bacteroidales bacterium]|nr:DUF748 domain-containing protein [Bacteroidales bacterium]